MSMRRRCRRFSILFASLVLVRGVGIAGSQTDVGASAGPGHPMGALVTTEWLSEHLDDQDLVVLDCSVLVEQGEDGTMRAVSGRAAYDEGYIPSASFADLKGSLRNSGSDLEFGLPSPEDFAKAMGALGVGNDSRVVLYDNYHSTWAARVWWMLRWIGFDRAALLDGGLQAWTAEGRPLSTGPASRPARKLTPAPRAGLIADRDEVYAAIGSDAVTIIDVMPAPHYQGKMAMYDRPGHITSAINIPVTDLVDESGRYRPLDELATMHDLDRNARAITYCGGGIAASSSAFIMNRLGFTDVAVYMGSLEEWAANPDNPMEVDAP
jgi:thiosulfate/3-mercaptopyruvate sulfurtransferase